MLLPSQVIPFLQHREKPVRDLAVGYLTKAHDPSPATADDLWKMIDRFGAGEHGHYYFDLAGLPQTEQSIERTVRALQEAHDSVSPVHLERILFELSYGMLLRTRDVIEQSPDTSQELKDHLARRIELSQVPRNDLIDQLSSLARKLQELADKDMETDEDDFVEAQRLVEALARHPESAPWAISTLNDESEDARWLEVWAVELLGRMHFRPAADLIVQKLMSDDEADFLIEECVDALVRIGSAEVVRIVAQRYPQMSWGIRLHSTNVLGRIKLPQSEQALIAAMNIETDRSLRTNLADAMCELCVTEASALSKLRDMVNEQKWDLTISDLDERAAALFTIIGQEIPELSRWRAQSADKGARAEARIAEYSKIFRSNEHKLRQMEERLEADQEQWDEAVPPWEPQQPTPQTDAPLSVTGTIRRDTPKVGRNDPCPCGSGKKFKKCCGK